MKKPRRSFAKSEEGAIMAEFAIVAGVFVVLMFGMIEFGLMFWQKNMVTEAARMGTRYAIVRGSESGRVADTASVSAYVRSRASLSPITVTTTWPTDKDPGSFVDVKVEYTHRLSTPFLGFVIPSTMAIKSSSRMVIVF